MNERVQELHAQAYLHALHNQIKAREDGIRESGTFNNDYREKFAELIAQECMECVRDVLRDEASDLTYTAADQVQSRIRQAFDIKE